MKYFDSAGYRIQFDAWGRPQDRAVLFFHGFPGSHLQAGALAPRVEKHKIYLIACDRPGYGGTTGAGSYPRYLDAVRALLGSLGVQKFDVVAVSGGAPLGHLIASRFPENVRSLQVVCGLGTYNKETAPYFSEFQNRGMKLRRLMPSRVAEAFFNVMLKNWKPEQKIERYLQFLNEADREVLRDPVNRDLILSSMKHARLQGAKGIVVDSAFYHRDWLRRDCDSRRLQTVPTVYFHGKKDRILNHGMAEWMHKANPKSQLQFFEDEGHYSLPLRQAEFILENLKRG